MVSSAKCMEERGLLSEESYICDGGPPWQAREGANREGAKNSGGKIVTDNYR